MARATCTIEVLECMHQCNTSILVMFICVLCFVWAIAWLEWQDSYPSWARGVARGAAMHGATSTT